MSEYRTVTFATTDDFVERYRELDREIVRFEAMRKAHIQAGRADEASQAAVGHSKALDAQEDLLFSAMQLLWQNARQVEDAMPELPESWEEEGSGRAIRCSFYEVESFRGL